MKPIVLCILDGVGINESVYGNAFKQARTPTLDYLIKEYPTSRVEACGEEVGLPFGQMGNSEVGHMNIGAGRIVYQAIEYINSKIKNGSFFDNEVLISTINHCKENNSKLHITGLISDGGIHSHINHLTAIIDMCKKEKFTNIYFHLFTDGRDTLPNSSLSFISKVEDKIKEVGFGSISTISGRYYAMDRDNRWERVKKAYDALVYGIGNKFDNADSLINESYKNNITDEFVVPGVIDESGIIESNDGIILFNFRQDRVRELFYPITNKGFNEFDIKELDNIKMATMMPISNDVIYDYAYKLPSLDNTLGEYLSSKGIKQLRLAETEKYPHVTYFFDGGVDKELNNCKRILVPSPKVATYDLQPEMSASEITDNLLMELDKNEVIIVNYANGDMVGHTGVMNAAIKAVEVLDECVAKVYQKVKELGGTLIVTADHGNCDVMLDEEGNVVTKHSMNKVYFIVTNKEITLNDGKLGNIAPTILDLIGLEKPVEMTEESLIVDKK